MAISITNSVKPFQTFINVTTTWYKNLMWDSNRFVQFWFDRDRTKSKK